ncbi:hypothetical protein EJB05_29606 [Eragrostis curvula]|uniref:Uncharacterized protein n=1 Tax=Eragrostis curvula TaxID=38414 RepID=A0A5J9UUV8_9POAL|nr:hypothetical protein EJB05_29606 [Eragrostis curvula]
MGDDNLKMPLLVSPLDSENLVIARLKDIIKENELLLGLLEEIKKKELHLAEIKKKKKLHLAEIKKKKKLLLADIKKTEELLLADIKKKELLREVEDKKKKQRFLSFLAVLAASLWALLSACLLGGFSAYNIFGPSTSHEQSCVDVEQCSECKTCYLLTSAAAGEVSAILYELLCCSVLQAAAAVLAPLLTGGRRCWTLAYAALAATTVGHCMHGRLRYLLLAAAAYPGDDRTIPGVLLGLAILNLVVDLLCFLFLILIRDDEDGGAFDTPFELLLLLTCHSVRPAAHRPLHPYKSPSYNYAVGPGSSVGSMDEDNSKMMPVSPLDSEKLVIIARLKENIKENEQLLAAIKKKELHLSEIEKKKKLLLANIKKTGELLLADIKKKELLQEVENKKKKQRFLSFLAVLAASLWALLSACLLGGFSAYNIFGQSTSHQESCADVAQCSECKTCYLLTSAAADEVVAILYRLLCCSVLQAAAALLALLLAGGRRCRVLAYAAVATTTIGHCMHGRLRYLLLAAAAYPGDDRTIPGVRLGLAILDLVVDLLCFLFLILTRDDEDGVFI